MTHLRKLLILAGMGGALILGTASFAQEHPPTPPQFSKHQEGGGFGRRHHGMGMVLQQLDLTPAQKDAIRVILETAKPKMMAIHDEMKKGHKALHDVTPDDPKYASIVSQAAQDEATAVSHAVQQRAAVMSDIYKQLTVDQKAKLQKIKAEMAWRHAIGEMPGADRHGPGDRHEGMRGGN